MLITTTPPTVRNCVLHTVGIDCTSPSVRRYAETLLTAKGLTLNGGHQPQQYTKLRVHPDGTFDRMWQLLSTVNPNIVTAEEFFLANKEMFNEKAA